MTAEAPLQGAGLGRSAPSAGPLPPHRNSWGTAARPAAGLPPKVCNFQLPEMSNFQLPLTGGSACSLTYRCESVHRPSVHAPA